jgi:hypothetical protein
MKVTDIIWETDGEVVDLPSEVEIDDDDVLEDEIADYLSDTYGWLVESFALPMDENDIDKN